jgi:deoxyribodipyrimidine photolyase
MRRAGVVLALLAVTKDLHVDRRKGAWHFWDLPADGEIANNAATEFRARRET